MSHIEVREVVLRDGLQDHRQFVATATKMEILHRCVATGTRSVEATSFVSPKVIPQLADAADLMRRVKDVDLDGTLLSVFVPTLRWMEQALEHPVGEVSTAVPATDGMSIANFRRTTEQMLDEAAAMRAGAPSVPMSVTVAVAFGCPYDGAVAPERVLSMVDRLVASGYERVLLGDTIGVATPAQVRHLVGALVERFPGVTFGGHFHDARGAAVANVVAAVDAGATMIDAALAGMGGCPFAPGAAGNVATEDVVWVLEDMGFKTGISLPDVAAAARWLGAEIGVELRSRTPGHRRFEWEVGAEVVSTR